MMKGQLAGLMKQAQAMQDNLKKAQDELAFIEVEGESGAGLVKVLADRKTDRLLGVHILAPTASEMIAEAVVAAIVDAARSGNESGDGLVWATPVDNVMHNRTGRSLDQEVGVR